MTTLHVDAAAQGRKAPGLCIRLFYRDGAGAIHFDWPLDQIRTALDDEKGTIWVDIEDEKPCVEHEAERLLSDVFRFHPLAVEDAIKETHVPKVDDWGEYLYIVFHTIDFDP